MLLIGTLAVGAAAAGGMTSLIDPPDGAGTAVVRPVGVLGGAFTGVVGDVVGTLGAVAREELPLLELLKVLGRTEDFDPVEFEAPAGVLTEADDFDGACPDVEGATVGTAVRAELDSADLRDDPAASVRLVVAIATLEEDCPSPTAEGLLVQPAATKSAATTKGTATRRPTARQGRR